ncbi:MAG: hypothetical protein ACJAXW_002078 [Candidatus Azotimanducaceae bacterium]|jgi:hypothetical protein
MVLDLEAKKSPADVIQRGDFQVLVLLPFSYYLFLTTCFLLQAKLHRALETAAAWIEYQQICTIRIFQIFRGVLIFFCGYSK